MNWRRGLLLAAIHLVVAVQLIRFMEARDAQFLRDREESTAEAAREAASTTAPAPANPAPAQEGTEQEGETVTFSPCGMWSHPPVQQTVVQFANFPTLAVTGWRMDCPPPWSLSGKIHLLGWTVVTTASIAAQRSVDWGLCALIPIQWFLVGGFPLLHPRRQWGEPGAFITICTVIAFGLVSIPAVAELAQLPALLVGLAWLWWFGLLVWKTLRFGWRLVKPATVHAR